MNKKDSEKFYEECMERQNIKESMLAVLLSAKDMPTASYLEALDDWVFGKISLEELDRNTDLGMYLED